MAGAAPSISDGQKKAFEDRLRRIAKGGPNTMGQIYVGEVASKEEAARRERAARRGPLMVALSLPTALVLGALSIMVGRFAEFHLISGQGAATVSQLADIAPMLGPVPAFLVVAVCLALLFRWSFHLKGSGRGLALMLGFAGAMLGEGMIIERAPALYASLYSDDYVLRKLYPELATSAPAPETQSMAVAVEPASL